MQPLNACKPSLEESRSDESEEKLTMWGGVHATELQWPDHLSKLEAECRALLCVCKQILQISEGVVSFTLSCSAL